MSAYLLSLPRVGPIQAHLQGVETSLKQSLRSRTSVRFDSWPGDSQARNTKLPLLILFESHASEFASLVPEDIRGGRQRVVVVVVQDDEHTKAGRSMVPSDVHVSGVVNVHVVPMKHELHQRDGRLCPRNQEAVKDIVHLLQDKGEYRPPQWDEAEFNIAVLGKTGVGKSTLINTYFRFMPGQPEAAQSGVVETTSRPARYTIPSSPVALWDTPGFGTQKVPEDEDYFTRIYFHLFDFYILVSCNKINEFEKEIQRKIVDSGKHLFYVRTKMDETVKNERRAHPRTFNQSETMTKIRDVISREFPQAMVWLVSGIDHEQFDFPQMQELVPHAAAQSADEHRKKEAETKKRGPQPDSSCILL